MQSHRPGTLYVVATPIGNLQDMTLRAIEVLKGVDRIAAEDTRHAAPLLNHFSIHKPILSLHNFNERERADHLLNVLASGESVALISDAGTPLISDPGFYLVKEARTRGVNVVPVPGACAAIAALSVAGLPTDRFVFEGFLPATAVAKRKRLQRLIRENRTLVFYEAPHRMRETLEVLVSIFGADRLAVLARELTKLYETIWSGTLEDLLKQYITHPDQQRGEMVLLVAGALEEEREEKMIETDAILTILLNALPLKQAVSLASEMTGERKNKLYEKALAKKG